MPHSDRRDVMRGLALLGLTAGLGPVAALAQAATPLRVRGTIDSLDGAMLTVVTREGPKVVVTLGEPLMVSALRRVTFSEITKGTSVGAVAVPDADGGLKAVAITVLPAGMRITERQVAWDLAPNTSMNDGPVEAVVQGNAGQELTLTINGRNVVLKVGADTPLLMPIPAARADLVAGATVLINATRGADNVVSATRVTVSKDGVAPAV